MPAQILPFIGIAALVIIIPGADMALVARNTIARGRSAGLLTVAGAGLGLGVHATAAAAGLSAIIATSATAFEAVKLVGAAFLVWMGLQTLWASRAQSLPAGKPSGPASPSSNKHRSPILEGLLTNVLNPKLAVFFLSFLPQFVSSEASATPQIVVLSAVFILMGALWLGFYVLAINSLSEVLKRPQVQLWMGRATGTALTGLGVRLAFVRPTSTAFHVTTRHLQ